MSIAFFDFLVRNGSTPIDMACDACWREYLLDTMENRPSEVWDPSHILQHCDEVVQKDFDGCPWWLKVLLWCQWWYLVGIWDLDIRF